MTSWLEHWKKGSLGQLGIPFPALIAPMVGLSHVAFRQLVRLYIPEGLEATLFTEMLSTHKLPHESLELVEELQIYPGESYFVPQLLGNEEKPIALSMAKLMPLKPWGFDINMGCPARQHLKHNWGVRLLGDANYAAEVVGFAKKSTHLPISVKMRCGQESANLDFLAQFTDKLEEAGADWLSIHARTQKQKHKGTAEWDLVLSLIPKRSIPLVINGDIQCAEDARYLLVDRQCQGVMIGRAATARPWILWQIAEDLGYPHAPLGMSGQKAPRTRHEEGRAYLQAMRRFLEILPLYFQREDKQLRRFRFHVAQSCKWLYFGHSYYKACMKAKTMQEQREMTETFLNSYEFPMDQRISLL